MSDRNLMDAGGSKAEVPLEDQDEVSLAKEKNRRQEMKGENFTTGPQQDFKSGQFKYVVGLPSSCSSEVCSTVDDLDESMGPGDRSIHTDRLSPVPSVLSMKSEQSMDLPIEFTRGNTSSHRQHTEELESVVCAVCPKRAFKSCLTCMASFCGDHVKAHYSAPALQRHRLVEATEDLEQRLCQRHNRELELYCRTDQTEICFLCLAVEHIAHDITELGQRQEMQLNKSAMEKKTGIPAPEKLTVVSVTPLSAKLSWSLHQGMEQIPHSFLISYHSEGTEPQTITTDSCSTTLTDLQPDTQYTVSVCCELRDGTRSDTSKKTIQTSIPAPEKLTVVSVTPLSAKLSWSLHQGMEQIPHSFLISYHSEGTEPQTITTDSCSTTLTDLQPDTQYTVSVCCELRDGTRSDTSKKTIQTSCFIPEMLVVEDLDKESVNSWKANLSWSHHQWMEQISHRFRISYHSGGTNSQTIFTQSCSSTLTDLQPDTEYKVSVYCELRDGKVQSQPASAHFHTSEWKIMLLGKTGVGKSSSGNTILGKELFKVESSQNSVTHQCKTHSRTVKGRKYTVIDTPGVFDNEMPEDQLKENIATCITESSPGLHAVIILLSVGRYTAQEKQVVEKILEPFSEEVFKHTVVLFTHGKDLMEGHIERFVEGGRDCEDDKKGNPLKELVEKCHGKCHVIDNAEWKNQEGESSNKASLEKLFATIEKMVAEHGCYSNDTLKAVDKAIEKEMEEIKRDLRMFSFSDLRQQAKLLVRNKVKIGLGKYPVAILMVCCLFGIVLLKI